MRDKVKGKGNRYSKLLNVYGVVKGGIWVKGNTPRSLLSPIIAKFVTVDNKGTLLLMIYRTIDVHGTMT